jgi:hypothetical protein
LSPAFSVLAFGWLLSSVVFLAEVFVKGLRNHTSVGRSEVPQRHYYGWERVLCLSQRLKTQVSTCKCKV